MSPKTAYLITFAMIIFMKIVCFILGYLTIRLGYRLITSGIKGQFKFSAKLGGLKADLASVSPGLLFVLLGVLLIGFAMYVEKGATLKEGLEKPEQKVKKPVTNIPPSPFENLNNNSNKLEDTSYVVKQNK